MDTGLKSLDFTDIMAMPCTVAVATVQHLAAVTTCTSEITPTTTPAHTLTWDTPTTLPTAVQLPVGLAAPCWPEVIVRLQYQISKCSTKLLRSKTIRATLYEKIATNVSPRSAWAAVGIGNSQVHAHSFLQFMSNKGSILNMNGSKWKIVATI